MYESSGSQFFRTTTEIQLQIQQEVQELQAFAFSVITVNDEHRKPEI